MQALRTTFHPATDTKGPRITACNAYGSKCTAPLRKDELPDEPAHRRAAQALCDKLQWVGELYGGHLSDSMVWVFDPKDEPKVSKQLTRSA